MSYRATAEDGSTPKQQAQQAYMDFGSADGEPRMVVTIPRHTDKYALWCNPGPVKRRQRFEVWLRHRGTCWLCGDPLGKWFDLHHTGYDNLRYEEASDLVAVHYGKCHRRAELEKHSEMDRILSDRDYFP